MSPSRQQSNYLQDVKHMNDNAKPVQAGQIHVVGTDHHGGNMTGKEADKGQHFGLLPQGQTCMEEVGLSVLRLQVREGDRFSLKE